MLFTIIRTIPLLHSQGYFSVHTEKLILTKDGWHRLQIHPYDPLPFEPLLCGTFCRQKLSFSTVKGWLLEIYSLRGRIENTRNKCLGKRKLFRF